MKKFLSVFTLILTILIAFSGCNGKVPLLPEDRQSHSAEITENISPETGEPLKPVEKMGNIPPEYTSDAIKKDLLSTATAVSDGYLLFSGGVEKYNPEGNLLWRKDYKEYPFMTEDPRYSEKITPAADGSFFMCYTPGTYQKDDGTWNITDPVLAKCGQDGALIWHKVYEGFSSTALEKVFCLSNGSVLTAGYTETPETKEIGTWSITDIYLSLLDKDGRLINEKIYGGSDFDSLYGAEYVDGIGLLALIDTQSRDGTFSASKDGYGVGVLMLVDDELNIKWHKALDAYMPSESMRIYDGAVYLLGLRNNYKKVDFSGKLVYSKQIFEGEKYSELVDTSRHGLLIQKQTEYGHQKESELVFYQDKTPKLTFDFDAGKAEQVIDIKDGFVIVSTNYTGIIPTSPYASAIHYRMERVYSGYKSNGELLWRNAYD